MTTCQICRKPIEECREADKQFITPFEPLNNNGFTIDYKMKRFTKVTKYILGCYNPDNNACYYIHGEHITKRLKADKCLSLPLCIWEGDNHSYFLTILVIIKENIEFLPLSKKYHNLLKGLLNDDLYDNLPDLPKNY